MLERIFVRRDEHNLEIEGTIDYVRDYLSDVEAALLAKFPTARIEIEQECMGYDGGYRTIMVAFVPETDEAYEKRVLAAEKQAKAAAAKRKLAKEKKDALDMKEYIRLQKKFGAKS